MTAYSFELHLAGLDARDGKCPGCDEPPRSWFATGALHLDFASEAASFSGAAGSAMHDIEKAGGRVLRVERIED